MKNENNKLSGSFLLAFFQKCVNSNVPKTVDALRVAKNQANIIYAENFESNDLILQALFVKNCNISYVNNTVLVTI